VSRNPTRVLCRCRQGKVSMWDGKCGHCRDADHPRKAIYGVKVVRPPSAPLTAKEADRE
jgi:hypothetical protein